ncbi:MAG: S46 family peptidase [Bacteroidetes bacterium]|nr:S46 family peptidase [Bacteroidota bacterium]
MKRISALLLGFILLMICSLRADEGMWLLSTITRNYEIMKSKGLELTPEQIYSVNNASLKDAIAGLGNSRMPYGFFCTAELISDKGLMLSNHHCGYEAIQTHSSTEHNYLKDGFWAKTYKEELPNESMCASFLVRMEDVTDKVLAGITDEISEGERNSKIREVSRAIQKEAKKDGYGASVESVFEGNKYYLFVYETYYDVRLVGAPPESIGKFGGDTDNWMWPRHTGDFCLMRVYTGPDGKPAKYSEDNIPYKPKYYLPVSLAGVEKEDFAMVLGFPGSTERYLSSYGIKEALEITNPAAIKIRTKKLEMMRKGMEKSEAIRIKYASKYAQTANYWKYFIGQNKGLKRLKVYDKKKELEEEFQAWADQDPERKKKYGDAVNLIKNGYAGNEGKAKANQYVMEALLQGGEVLLFPAKTIQFAGVLENSADNKELIAQMAEELKESSKEVYKDYDPQVDKDVARELLKLYYNDVQEEYRLDIFKEINKKYKGDLDKFVDDVFGKSIFADEQRFLAFLEKPTAKALNNDWAYKLMNSIIQQYFKIQGGGNSEDLSRGRRLFIAGLMEMQPDKIFYPDANSTLRLTYGSVGDYEPADAVYYDYYTTIDGVMEKEDPDNQEFIVPDKLKELYKNKDYGRYADKDGNLHVCFTTDNDITGGNSGSPVINGRGELIGAAFDGNWEAMSGDIAFEHDLQKCINCDIRYILFIIDKVGGATHLVDEMNIVQ